MSSHTPLIKGCTFTPGPSKHCKTSGFRHSTPLIKGVWVVRVFVSLNLLNWGHAKGAAKASCEETVFQKGVFGESASSLLP